MVSSTDYRRKCQGKNTKTNKKAPFFSFSPSRGSMNLQWLLKSKLKPPFGRIYSVQQASSRWLHSCPRQRGLTCPLWQSESPTSDWPGMGCQSLLNSHMGARDMCVCVCARGCVRVCVNAFCSHIDLFCHHSDSSNYARLIHVYDPNYQETWQVLWKMLQVGRHHPSAVICGTAGGHCSCTTDWAWCRKSRM